jgi:nitrous oxidase accessory protein NosD
VIGCTFEQMGDTAVAFHPAAQSAVIAHNVVANCTATNTQYLANGFAFDVEGGFRWGVLHHNLFIGNTVVQTEQSRWFQGGLTMNLFSQDSSIVGNVMTGNLHSTNDCGIAVPGTRNMVVTDNVIERFRGQAVYADGAASLTVRGNRIRDCGSAERAFFSAILLADARGSQDVTVASNEFSWSDGYRFSGPETYAVAASAGGGMSVRNLVVRENIIRTPGGGILIAGTEGAPVAGAVVEANLIEGTAGRRPMGLPIRARHVDRLSVRNNRLYQLGDGIDVTGSRGAEVRGNTQATGGRPQNP